jgi:YYY domain-containing protein
MLFFIAWYILITLLGWITFPLAQRLFPVLADRGYTLSRALGLLIWGYVFWLFASLGIAQNDLGGLLLGLVVLGGVRAWIFLTDRRPLTVDREDIVYRPQSMVKWLKANKSLVIVTELLFLLAFAFMAFVRASNPETTTAGGEKWMEVAFINAILHSPTFPPHDPWLSGYAISYYYFGYVMTSMLAMFTSTPASVAHNLMVPLIFALSAIGAYGILYNLLALYKSRNHDADEQTESPSRNIFSPLFAPLFLLIISNAEGFLQSLHNKGLFWQLNADGTFTSTFWTWLDIPDLKNPPVQPLSWIPTQFYWWWRASRVVQDYELNGAYHEVIDEFPFFSYLLGDLHPHVLAMPFMLLAIAMALNIFLGGWRGKIDLYIGQLNISKTGFFVSALMLGGMAFLNTWDILPGAALIVFSYALFQVREAGWGWERIEDVLLLGIPLMIVAYVMYLPFFISFASQAGGIVPSFMFPTRGAQLWVMWGTLFVPLFALLIYLWHTKTPANWRAGVWSAVVLVLALLVLMFLFGFLALTLKPDLINPILQLQGLDAGAFVAESMKLRLAHIGSLLTLLAILIPVLSFLFGDRNQTDESHLQRERAEGEGYVNNPDMDNEISSYAQPAILFTLLLIALGALLILGPDFFYLRDNFGYRINTVFKFYYQAWEMLSLAAAFGVALLFANLRGRSLALYSTVMALVFVVGLAYPVFSLPNKTDNFKVANPSQRTLDGAAYLANTMGDDYQAMQFMEQLALGVVVEAVGGQYSEYARIATFTGLPTVLGWPGHEGQWRPYALQGSREEDIKTLYSTPDWSVADSIIKQYNIRYIYVGNLERTTYHVNEEKFARFLKPIYQQGSVNIYIVP